MRRILIIILLSPFLGHSQSLKNLKVVVSPKFDKEASITVNTPSYDQYGMAGMFANDLFENGFNVVSDRVTDNEIELKNNVKNTDSSLNQKLSLGSKKYIKSKYVLNFKYNSVYTGDYITNVTGEIVDLDNGGELVATFSYHHGAMGARGSHIVVDKICSEMRDKLSRTK